MGRAMSRVTCWVSHFTLPKSVWKTPMQPPMKGLKAVPVSISYQAFTMPPSILALPLTVWLIFSSCKRVATGVFTRVPL